MTKRRLTLQSGVAPMEMETLETLETLGMETLESTPSSMKRTDKRRRGLRRREEGRTVFEAGACTCEGEAGCHIRRGRMRVELPPVGATASP